LANLSSAARSASELTAWLLNEYRCPEAPLKDVRLLLSPVDGEALNADVLARMGGQPAPATRAAVKAEFTAFMEACASPADRALVFVVGHGIQLSPRSAIVLLEDFATDSEPDLLFGAMDVIGCHDAMRKFGGADHQAWFSDACRQRPEIVRRFEALEGAFKPGNIGLAEVAASPVFLSSSTRENAFADPQGLTIFTQALLWALRGAAAVGKDETCPVWHVSSSRLSLVLPTRVKALAQAGGADQSVDLTGKPLDVVVQQFDAPPQVDIEVAVNPANLDPLPVAELRLDGNELVAVQPGWPLRLRATAGLYELVADVGGAAPQRKKKLLNAQPPACKEEVQFP
ncbi:MAG TPA: caspase family protein, partial [Pedococcus sp.]|nr:caspase family protein [Pedococcus sp.]